MTQIDDVVSDVLSHDAVLNTKKRKLHTRPLNWREITEHFNIYGFQSTLTSFPEDLSIYTVEAAYCRIRGDWNRSMSYT